ncbi:unnamed protein product [Sphenostylis stenocarpa]|uniref:Bulb-type lectin domain-containing protein n=1 Tax=Sphenostylis stenocarpa TaxID=92480 RepID=A0AA86W4W0_9FABA|nr:unnamed protein product [Sphenostylis stenocarpa]
MKLQLGYYYFGILYKRIPVKTVVWVANRINPIKEKPFILHINREGNLVIETKNGTVVWTALADSKNKAYDPILHLLNSVNMVLRDERDDPENFLWHWKGTLNLLCGRVQQYSIGVVPGMVFVSVVPQNWREIYFLSSNLSSNVEDIYESVPRDNCDYDNLCGPCGNCIIGDSQVSKLCCKDKSEDGFLKLSGLTYPDTIHAWVNESMDLNKCRETCLNNCSYTAYANLNIKEGGSGFMLWYGDLKDMRQFSGEAWDLYIRRWLQ